MFICVGVTVGMNDAHGALVFAWMRKLGVLCMVIFSVDHVVLCLLGYAMNALTV